MNPDTIDKFNDWLAEYFDPARTAKGRIRTSKGVHVYPASVHERLQILVGGYGKKALRRARAGDGVPSRLKKAITQTVEWWDLETIRARRRDQKWLEAVSHAQHIHSISGTAPDGGSLEEWCRERFERLSEKFDTEDGPEGEAAEVWAEICEPREPKANRLRRERRAA